MLKITPGCRAGAICPAGYMGRQELNIDQFVNPPEVQAARREGGSNSREKKGEALCLKKLNKTLRQYARQSAREAKKRTFVLCFVRAGTVPQQQGPLQRCERLADAAPSTGDSFPSSSRMAVAALLNQALALAD